MSRFSHLWPNSRKFIPRNFIYCNQTLMFLSLSFCWGSRGKFEFHTFRKFEKIPNPRDFITAKYKGICRNFWKKTFLTFPHGISNKAKTMPLYRYTVITYLHVGGCCKIKKKKMNFIFVIFSNGLVPLYFGSKGTGHMPHVASLYARLHQSIFVVTFHGFGLHLWAKLLANMFSTFVHHV